MPPLEGVLLRLREGLALVFAGPEPVGKTRSRDLRITLAFAAAAGAWSLAYKLKSFYGLGTTSDLYETTQLATTWLHGRYLEDNCFGSILSIHTYLFTPVLAVLAWPLGAPGLLAAAALAAAAAFVATVRILQLLSVPLGAALAYASVVSFMPLTVNFYQDSTYGFHVELLLPAMGLWLMYFALRRSWTGSLLMGLAIVSVKEDAPLVAIAVGAIVACEDALRSPSIRAAGAAGARRGAVNFPALALVALGCAAVPVLLHILKLNPPSGYSPGSFERIRGADGIMIRNPASLLTFVVGHFAAWFRSPSMSVWISLAIPATLGLFFLRPHLILVGLPLTVTSWLMHDDLLWAPRFANALTFFEVVGVLAFASACAVTRRLISAGIPGRVAAVAAAVLAAFAVNRGLRAQMNAVPDAREVYTLTPIVAYDAGDRARADVLFAVYRRDSNPQEPVIASPYLFRYAHDRNLYWFDRLNDRPEPVWILWDGVDLPAPLEAAHYALVGQNGRFSLYKKKGG
jgi:hypothetical protein